MTSTVRMVRTLLLGTLLVASAPYSLSAQTNERIYEDLDFRFVTPGARPVGMGKTFIGLADDATAAASNPAGLSNLLEQEFSVEFVGTRIRHDRFIPSNNGQVQTFGEQVLTPSFLSYVLPVRRATFSMFRHSVQDYRESFAFGGRFIEGLGGFEDGAYGTIAIQAENYGVAGAYVVHRMLSVGGSISLSALDAATEARSGLPEIRAGEQVRANPRNGTNTIDSDLKWTGIIGVLAKPWKGLALGATYNRGTTFELTTRLFGSFLRTRVPGDPSTRESVDRTGEEFPIDYVIPARYSFGASWRPLDHVTLLADVSRIAYSTRVTDRFLIVDFQDPDAGLITDEGSRRCRQPCNFFVNDVTELHAGAEYRWYRPGHTMAFRGGLFTDPDHQLRFRSGGNNLDHPADRILNFRFNTVQPKTDIGATAGWGIALGNRFQVDVAGSFSHDATEVVVSTVIRLR